jgi:16S rRNA processing protein RimM
MNTQLDSPRPTQQQWTVLARIIRPQGRHGEVLADILTDFPERFSERRTLVLKHSDNTKVPDKNVTLESHWLHKDRVVFKFAGVDSISDAELLRGMEVVIPQEQRAPLEEDSVYISDLIGCSIFDCSSGEAKRIGEIIDVDREMTSTALLVVRPIQGDEELLIPFVKAYLRNINLEQKRIEMLLPEGLLAINAPPPKEDDAT